MPGPKAEIIAQIEVALPGYSPMSAQIAKVPGETIELDALAIELHQTLNEVIMEIRKRGRTDG